MKTIARYVLALIGLALLAYGSLVVGKDGLSSLRVQRSIDNASLASADEAIRLNPFNPDAYNARALLYQKAGQVQEAISDFERSVELRPSDHLLWLELGNCRYQVGDMDGAITDFGESVRFAPFYWQPHWYLGKVLLQTGKPDEGFAELRRAVTSDPFYLSNAIQLADEVYSGDDRAIVQAIQPRTSATRLALAQYFIKGNKVPAAMELFRGNETMSATDQRTLLSDLLAAKRFGEAYEVWLVNHPELNNKQSIPFVNNGGFESEIGREALGFEWQVSRNLQRTRVVRDERQPQSGAFSLRLDFDGNSSPDTEIVSQLLLTEGATQYDLSFASRTQELITGGPPVVVVVDANSGELLAQSKPINETQTEWQHSSVEFSTRGDTHAVVITVQRKACGSSPCPAFGHAWFDSFVCKKL